jgi:transposase
MPTSMAACQRDLLQEELQEFEKKVQRVTKELDAIGASHLAVQLLRTIPGVGPRTAEAIVAYLDNPQRFERAGQVGAYFGLVPCQDASAGANRLGHITKEGPATARKLLVEATWQLIRRCPAARDRFDRIAAGKKDRRKIALVATAHWLLRCMFAMLRTGRAWNPAA